MSNPTSKNSDGGVAMTDPIRQALQPLIKVAEKNLGAGYAREATEEVIKRLKEMNNE